MRRYLIGTISALLVACSQSGGSDPSSDSERSPPPPGTPQDNATAPPPVEGTPAPDGVFVSTSLGDDSGGGTRERPFKTLKKAVQVAQQQQVRVLACAETYAENLEVVDGVSIYGYFDCRKPGWDRVRAKAVIDAPSSPAVLANGITRATRIEGFEVRAPDMVGAPATDSTGTSIALEVRGSKNLALGEVLIHAGKGAPGTDGADGPMNARMNASSDGAKGEEETSRSCPQPAIPISVCQFSRYVPGFPGGATTCAIVPNGGAGGAGGDPRHYALLEAVTESAAGPPYDWRGRPLAASAATAVGGTNSANDGYGTGRPGADGARGEEGTDGVNGLWSLTTAGFARGNGTAGGAGGSGQGGGGGGSPRWFYTPLGTATRNLPGNADYYQTAAGGGGGAGGCAGQPGTPATGGGASIGALVIDSSVNFERSRVESSNGGRGGQGNLGTPGIAGGKGGAQIARGLLTIAGKGGDGGEGGNGGASGHGAPGPSIALVYSGTRPTLTSTDLAPGPAGAGQPALKRATTNGEKVLPAIDGASKPEHEIK